MKKLIVRFIAFLLIVGGLTTSFLIVKPKDLKADTPELYYFSYDSSHENYLTIILYVYDVAVLDSDSCYLIVFGGLNSPPYKAFTNVYNVQFLRYSSLDHDDYDAYVYNFNYPTLTDRTGYMIELRSNNVLGFDNSVYVDYNLYMPYDPFIRSTYDDGYDDGYHDGEDDAIAERNAYWEQYINDEYIDPQGPGYQLIYQRGRSDGFTAGQQSLDTMSWFQTITSGVSNIMNISLLPSITIGALIFIPIMFMILSAVLWIWRKK